MPARAGGVPLKLVGFSNMSCGLDKMVVTKDKVESTAGIDTTVVEKLAAEGYLEKYKSSKWIGRLGL